MKILTLVFKLDQTNTNPSIRERLALIDECLASNPDTDILVCSEAFLSLIDNTEKKFTAVDMFTFDEKEMKQFPQEYDESSKPKLIEQNRLKAINEFGSTSEIIDNLYELSDKYPKTLIIPGTLFERSSKIQNIAYLFENSQYKRHEKLETFTGFEDIFKLKEFDDFKSFDDPKYLRIKQINKLGKKHTKYTINDTELTLAICSDTCPSNSRNHLAKLSIFLAPSYGLPPPSTPQLVEEITKNIDVYIQPDGLDWETHVVKNPNFTGNFTVNEIGLGKYTNTIKCFVVNINVPESNTKLKYYKYKNKYINLKKQLGLA